MVRAVLFDADGVLVDACELHYVALNRALGTMGWNISHEEHLATYNGLPTQKKLELLTEKRGFPADWHKEVHSLKQQYTWEAIDECLTVDTSKQELLRCLLESGKRIAVCSNSLKKTLHKMLATAGLSDLTHLALGNDDVSNPKPAPEMYLAAAEKLRVPIAECVIVEDSPIGMAAAKAAKPWGIVEVVGPAEVNLSIIKRIESCGLVKEAA